MRNNGNRGREEEAKIWIDVVLKKRLGQRLNRKETINQGWWRREGEHPQLKQQVRAGWKVQRCSGRTELGSPTGRATLALYLHGKDGAEVLPSSEGEEGVSDQGAQTKLLSDFPVTAFQKTPLDYNVERVGPSCLAKVSPSAEVIAIHSSIDQGSRNRPLCDLLSKSV